MVDVLSTGGVMESRPQEIGVAPYEKETPKSEASLVTNPILSF